VRPDWHHSPIREDVSRARDRQPPARSAPLLRHGALVGWGGPAHRCREAWARRGRGDDTTCLRRLGGRVRPPRRGDLGKRLTRPPRPPVRRSPPSRRPLLISEAVPGVAAPAVLGC